MKIYFAGRNEGATQEMDKHGFPRLVSYFYHKGKPLPPNEVFVDSGAYSVKMSSAQILLDEYCEWLHSKKDNINVYANLDVINSEVESWKNQKAMEKRGLSPMPVFHVGEPFSYFQAMVHQYTYIGIGVTRELPVKEKLYWLDRCFALSKDRVAIHGFGVTRIDWLLRYPFYSVDSTSWVMSASNGMVLELDGCKIKGRSYKNQKKANHKTIGLADQDTELKYCQRAIHNAFEYKKVEDLITRIWRERGVKWPKKVLPKLKSRS